LVVADETVPWLRAEQHSHDPSVPYLHAIRLDEGYRSNVRICRPALQVIWTVLRHGRDKRCFGQVCPSVPSKRYCHESVALLFLAENCPTIPRLRSDVPEEMFASAMPMERPYGLITAFGDRRSGFYMRAPVSTDSVMRRIVTHPNARLSLTVATTTGS
jgi:hypothetical protein